MSYNFILLTIWPFKIVTIIVTLYSLEVTIQNLTFMISIPISIGLLSNASYKVHYLLVLVKYGKNQQNIFELFWIIILMSVIISVIIDTNILVKYPLAIALAHVGHLLITVLFCPPMMSVIVCSSWTSASLIETGIELMTTRW